MNIQRKTIIKLALVIVVVGALLWINQRFFQVTPERIRTWILSFGAVAPLLYVMLYILRPLILFPASILSLAGGLAFGVWVGSILTLIGATGGAVVSFIVARNLGRSMQQKQWTGRMETVQEQLEKHGFFYVLLLRLIPLFHFDLISYVAGVSKVRFRAFLSGTIVGMVPGVIAYTFLGSSLVAGDLVTIVLAIFVFLIVLLIPVLASKKVKEKFGMKTAKK
ncbi:TVP38/TMEM64 family protein [Shouchella shacheensis]|uniref:TVP38/TMEM64 family protein n=1 Tax=Shouchella shacheensis TaxID=1649580 RepID=UPI0007404D09|nr:TVP38/TMEM64 family protein [Shouchella shacheensis]